MKTVDNMRDVLLLPALLIALGATIPRESAAQNLTVLRHFCNRGGDDPHYSDGANPQAALILWENVFYGTTEHITNCDILAPHQVFQRVYAFT